MQATLVAFLVVLAAEPAKPAAGPSLYSRTTVDLGMVVSDLGRSLKFYRDDLGLVSAGSFDVTGDLARDAGLTDGKPLHVEVLALGEGETATKLKLLAFPGAKGADSSTIDKALGVRYLTLLVKDMDAVLARMKERSIPVLAKGPVSLPGGGAAIALVRDPDGNFIEFVGPAGAPSAGGFKPLFDGKTLAGWKPVKNGAWKVADGAIVGEQGEKNGGGWLQTEKTYGDFELRFKFRLSKNANSGIGFRYPAGDDVSPAKTGYELQLSEADPNYRTGSIFGLGKAPDGLVREGEWSEGRLVARGKKIETWIGGKPAISIESDRSARGLIGLQVHGGPRYEGTRVEFKDIEIRE
jgi:catechol 2,3-dioxygenase-like lactoylglutathione lyase family enzyme